VLKESGAVGPADRRRRGVRTTSIRRGAVALGLLALAGCGSSTYGGSSSAGSSSSAASSSSAGAATSDAVLKASGSSLGKVVVDSGGRTVYVFDKDSPGAGTSACTGACLAKWPPVPAPAGKLAADGVTGKVGTITRDDGTKQLTLGGMPLYLFAGDSHAGDVTGQAVGGTWWAVSPDGAKITGAPAAVPGY
jgi:predicted lipoprotein with Yx(FWY)xxD motif